MTREIIVADDHAQFRDVLKSAVADTAGDLVYIEVDTIAGLLGALESHGSAALLLLDLNMPGAQGFNALAYVRGRHPAVPVVIVSADDDSQTVAAALRYGAQGFLPKSTESGQLGQAVATVLDGGTYLPVGFQMPRATASDTEGPAIARRIARLTAPQFRVLGMLCAGLHDQQIASELDASEAMVAAEVAAILRQLDVATRTQAVLAAGRLAVDRASVKPFPEES